MKLTPVWLFLGVVTVFTACVPNRKYVYLQKDDVNRKNLPKDSVVRTYQMQIREYRIQPLDLLSIRIESLTDEEFDFFSRLYPSTQGGGGNQVQNAFLLDNVGEVEFPVVGKVKLAGHTVFEAQDKLQQVFSPYLKDPVARIRLLNFRFTLLGEVSGEKQVISTNTRVTLMEAIALGGGLSELADRENVKIIRQKGDQSEVFYVNLLEEDLLASEYYYIQQNDIIVVPPLRQRPFRRYWGPNIAVVVSSVSVVLFIMNLIDDNNDNP